jgi:hypothetical protein
MMHDSVTVLLLLMATCAKCCRLTHNYTLPWGFAAAAGVLICLGTCGRTSRPSVLFVYTAMHPLCVLLVYTVLKPRAPPSVWIVGE